MFYRKDRGLPIGADLRIAPLLIALTLILSVSCSNKKGKTNVQFGRMFLNGAPTFTGGLGIFGKNDAGNFFTYTLTDDSTIPPMDIPNGNWTFWAVGWSSANKLEGVTKCGMTSANLTGGDVGVAMILNQTNCGSSQLATPAFINGDQFHPVVVSSCYLQTIVDETTTCDSSFKGEHRSFRFKIDTISNFGPLPNPQPIISNCFDEASGTSGSSTTTVTIPAGSAAGVPLNVIIEAFPNTGCTGAAQFFNMPKGFFGPGSQSKTFAGASQTKVYLDSILPTSGPINSIAYMNLSADSITTAFVNIHFDFLDDDNANSSATIQLCNDTTVPGCTLAGSTAMTRGTTTYDATFVSHAGNPGDSIRYNVTVTDGEGTSATLPDQFFNIPVSAPTGLTFNTPASSPSNVTSPVFDVNGTIAGGTVTLHYTADCSDAAQGSTAGAVTVTPVALSGLTDGTYTIYAKQTINTVESACSSSSITYVLDTVAPSNPTALSFVTSSPSNNITPDVTASSLTVGNGIKFYTDVGCTAPNVGPIAISSATEVFTLASLTDGGHNIYTKVFDPAGNGSSCLFVGSMTIDTVAPTAPTALTGSAQTNDSTPDITVTHSEAGGMVNIYSDSGCTLLKGSAAGNGSNVAVTSSSLTDGAYTYYANQVDEAGNISTCSGPNFAFSLDTIAPNIVSITRVGVSPTNSGTINYQVVFSEAISTNPVAGDFVHTTVSGGVTDAIGSITGGTTTYNVAVSISGGDGDVRLDLNDLDNTITDISGNPLLSNVYSGGQVFTIDNTGPQFVSISSTNGTYLEIQDVDIIVTFNENTFATGSTLNLAGGRSAAYFSGNGTTTITYRYTVDALDNLSAPLDYASSLPISGGSIQDTLGNVSGSVTFPTPGAAGSLSFAQSVLLLGSARFQWGGLGNETKSLIARKDSTGEVFMALETTNATPWGSGSGTDIVLAKFDPFGNNVSSFVIVGNGNETLGGIIYNQSNNSIYIIGTTTSTNLYTGGLNGANDYFLGNYDTNLNSITETMIPVNGPQPPIQAITIDYSTNTLYLAGYNTSGSDSSGPAGCTGTAKSFIASIDLSNPNAVANCAVGGGASSAILSLTTDHAGSVFAAGFVTGTSGGDSFVAAGSGADQDMHIWKYDSNDLSNITAMYRHDTSNTDNSSKTSILLQNGYIFVAGDTNGASFGSYTAGSAMTDYYVYSADASDLVTSPNQYQYGVSGYNTLVTAIVGDSSLGEVTVIGLTEGALAVGATKSSSVVPDLFLDTLDELTLSSLTDFQFDDFNAYEQSPNSVTDFPYIQSAIISDDGLQIWMSGKAVGNLFGSSAGGSSDSYLFMMTAP